MSKRQPIKAKTLTIFRDDGSTTVKVVAHTHKGRRVEIHASLGADDVVWIMRKLAPIIGMEVRRERQNHDWLLDTARSAQHLINSALNGGAS